MSSKLIILFLLIALQHIVHGQSHYSDQWIGGGGRIFRIDFTKNPVETSYFIDTNKVIYAGLGNSSICDSSGRPILFSDGYNLYDSIGNYIEDGDTLVSMDLFFDHNGFSSFSQSSIILPFPDNIYYLITPNATDSIHADWYTIPYYPNAWFDEILLHKIDMNANGGLGKVVERGKKIMKQEKMLRTMMMACRHANGKDWWLLKQMYEDSGNFDGLYPLCKNKIAKILITKDSIYPPTFQYFNAPDFGFFEQSGQAMFNQDGTKYASTCRSTNKVFLADFDRCTGMLNNGKAINVPDYSRHDPSDTTLQDVYTQGLCFSPNGQFLYVNKFFNLLQYDLTDADSSNAWYHIAGLDTTWQAFQKYSSSYLGPDLKIYVGNWWGVSKQMSVIDNPDVKGAGSNFCPRCLRFPYVGASSPPNMPNYDLGAGLPCWPLSLPNPPKEGDDMLMVYPNPASTSITISCKVLQGKHIEVSLYNMLGQEVLSKECHFAQQKSSIDVSNLPRGAYLLKVGEWVRRVFVE